MNFESLGDPKMGIVVYKNALTDTQQIIEDLEESLSSSDHEMFSWKEALVGEGTKIPEYRDCYDFKINYQQAMTASGRFSKIKDSYEKVSGCLGAHLKKYQEKYNISMNYMEAINFVKYGPKQHFAVHADHGFSYICTVSSIVYLNDNYQGGELWFPYLDLKIKPSAGDMIFFPSTYIYAHASLPVTEGVKYSAVTMFDYNDDAHKHNGFSRNFLEQPLYSHDQPSNTSESIKYISDVNSFEDEHYLRRIIREEIQTYAMESWKQWQEQGGASHEYSNYVAGANQ